MDPVSSNNASTLSQLMAMMQLLVQNITTNQTPTPQAFGQQIGAGAPGSNSSNPGSFTPNSPSLSDGVYGVLVETQAVSPSTQGESGLLAGDEKGYPSQDFGQVVQSLLPDGTSSEQPMSATQEVQNYTYLSGNIQAADISSPANTAGISNPTQSIVSEITQTNPDGSTITIVTHANGTTVTSTIPSQKPQGT